MMESSIQLMGSVLSVKWVKPPGSAAPRDRPPPTTTVTNDWTMKADPGVGTTVIVGA
jgi:hypothetical protein